MLVALKQHTNTEVLGRLGFETQRNVSEAEEDDGRSEDDLLEEYIRQLRLSSSRRGYKLKISPGNCHHRLGASEIMVNILKNYFKDLPRTKTLSLVELQYLVKKF